MKPNIERAFCYCNEYSGFFLFFKLKDTKKTVILLSASHDLVAPRAREREVKKSVAEPIDFNDRLYVVL